MLFIPLKRCQIPKSICYNNTYVGTTSTLYNTSRAVVSITTSRLNDASLVFRTAFPTLRALSFFGGTSSTLFGTGTGQFDSDRFVLFA